MTTARSSQASCRRAFPDDDLHRTTSAATPSTVSPPTTQIITASRGTSTTPHASTPTGFWVGRSSPTRPGTSAETTSADPTSSAAAHITGRQRVDGRRPSGRRNNGMVVPTDQPSTNSQFWAQRAHEPAVSDESTSSTPMRVGVQGCGSDHGDGDQQQQPPDEVGRVDAV